MKISTANVRTVVLLLGMLLLLPGWAVAVEFDDQDAAKGLAILQKNCARCHALGLTGASPHPQAPRFRDVVKRYPVEDLEESLAEGIVSGHPDMPEFTFGPNQIGAIVAYLNSLKAQENAK